MAKASSIAEVYNITPSIPITTERQQHRNNVDADAASAYLHMTVTNSKAHWLLYQCTLFFSSLFVCTFLFLESCKLCLLTFLQKV